MTNAYDLYKFNDSKRFLRIPVYLVYSSCDNINELFVLAFSFFQLFLKLNLYAKKVFYNITTFYKHTKKMSTIHRQTTIYRKKTRIFSINHRKYVEMCSEAYKSAAFLVLLYSCLLTLIRSW